MKVPFQYQLDGIEQLREGIRQGKKRLLLTMLMAAGKTLTALELSRLAIEKDRQVAFITDRRMLVKQGLEEAREQGLYAAAIMAGYGRDPYAPIQFISKASLFSWLNRNVIDLPRADVVFIDEAHRAVAGEYKKCFDLWPNAIFIGLTATPCHGDGSGMGDIYEFLAEPIKPSELARMGRIVPVRYFAPHIPNLTGIRKNTKEKDYNVPELAARMTKECLVGDVVGWWKKLADERPTVYFCCNKAHADIVLKEFLDAGIPSAMIIDETDDSERDRIRDAMEAGAIQVVVSVDCLSEGVNWPFLAVCGLLRPTKRFRRYLQMVGRVFRAYPGKAEALVIDHSGCAIYHGFADDDIEWGLDKEFDVDQKKEEFRKKAPEAQPHPCLNCQALFKGKVCPMCGHVCEPPKPLYEKKSRAGVLIEMARDVNVPEEVRQKAMNNFWISCICLAIKRDRTAGFAAMIFQKRFGAPPWKAHVEPLAESNHWRLHAKYVWPQYAPKLKLAFGDPVDMAESFE